MASKTKITEAGARTFAPADGREAVLWDSAAPGLGLRARPNGRKTWVVHRRCNGSVVKRTLGALDALTVEDARHAARALLADAEAKRAPATVPTVRTFAPAFLAGCAERWKPATRRAHADGVRRHILPAFGESPRRCGYREGRAQLVRRSLGHAGGVGKPGAGGAVVDDEARGSARPAARGLQPLQGTAAAQDGLRGALPDG